MKTKMCNGCATRKPINQFSKLKSASDGLNRACKPCNARWRVTHYEKHKARLKAEIKGRKETLKTFVKEQRQTKCSRCPENHPATIDFHHIDPNTKDFEIADAWALGIGIDRISKEIAKCSMRKLSSQITL